MEEITSEDWVPSKHGRRNVEVNFENTVPTKSQRVPPSPIPYYIFPASLNNGRVRILEASMLNSEWNSILPGPIPIELRWLSNSEGEIDILGAIFLFFEFVLRNHQTSRSDLDNLLPSILPESHDDKLLAAESISQSIVAWTLTPYKRRLDGAKLTLTNNINSKEEMKWFLVYRMYAETTYNRYFGIFDGWDANPTDQGLYDYVIANGTAHQQAVVPIPNENIVYDLPQHPPSVTWLRPVERDFAWISTNVQAFFPSKDLFWAHQFSMAVPPYPYPLTLNWLVKQKAFNWSPAEITAWNNWYLSFGQFFEPTFRKETVSKDYPLKYAPSLQFPVSSTFAYPGLSTFPGVAQVAFIEKTELSVTTVGRLIDLRSITISSLNHDDFRIVVRGYSFSGLLLGEMEALIQTSASEVILTGYGWTRLYRFEISHIPDSEQVNPAGVDVKGIVIGNISIKI